jgi:hypothetical protein
MNNLVIRNGVWKLNPLVFDLAFFDVFQSRGFFSAPCDLLAVIGDKLAVPVGSEVSIKLPL